MAFDYTHLPYPVREEMVSAHRAYWEELSHPGSHFTGRQRVAIAREVRRSARCVLCTERKAALSASQIAGEHEGGEALSAACVEAVHRIATDASRLSKGWLEKLLASGLGDGQYVELLGVVTAVMSIDRFHRALGIALEELPEPVEGEPDGYRPAAATPGVAWVPWIPGSKAKGLEAEDPGGPEPPPQVAGSVGTGSHRSNRSTCSHEARSRAGWPESGTRSECRRRSGVLFALGRQGRTSRWPA